MYAITLVCTDNVSLNQQWSRVLYSAVPLSQQDAILALAGDFTRQQLPAGWRQMSDAILQYGHFENEFQLRIGSVMLNGAKWSAACDHHDLGSFATLEAAMAAVESFK